MKKRKYAQKKIKEEIERRWKVTQLNNKNGKYRVEEFRAGLVERGREGFPLGEGEEQYRDG